MLMSFLESVNQLQWFLKNGFALVHVFPDPLPLVSSDLTSHPRSSGVPSWICIDFEFTKVTANIEGMKARITKHESKIVA